MSAEGTLMEPTAAPTEPRAPPRRAARLRHRSGRRAGGRPRRLSIARSRAELDRRGEEHEFLFVFDGGFTPPPELVALSHEQPSVRLFSFARTFGETAALRLGIERSRGDVIVTLPAYFQVQAEGMGPLLDALAAGADLVVASRSPRVDSWLNRLQSRVFHRMLGGRDRSSVPRHRLRRARHAASGRRGAAALRRPAPLHPGARAARGIPGGRGRRCRSTRTMPRTADLRAGRLSPAAARRGGVLLSRQVHREAAAVLRPGRGRCSSALGAVTGAGPAGGALRRPGHRQPSAPAARGAVASRSACS